MSFSGQFLVGGQGQGGPWPLWSPPGSATAYRPTSNYASSAQTVKFVLNFKQSFCCWIQQWNPWSTWLNTLWISLLQFTVLAGYFFLYLHWYSFFLLITPVDNIYLCCMLYFLFQLEYFLFSFYPSIVCIPFPSSGNFSIWFWRQYTSLFASIAAIVFLFLTSDRKSSRCEKHVINVGDRFP